VSWIALGCLLVALLGVLAHLVAIDRQAWIVLATGSPYLVAFSPVSVALFAVAGQNYGLVAALLVLAAVLVLHAPLYRRSSAAMPAGRVVRVLTSNIEHGVTSPAAVVELASRFRVDLLLVQELAAEAVTRFQQAGIEELLPHAFLRPRPNGQGTGIFSAVPLQEMTSHDGFGFELLSARLQVPQPDGGSAAQIPPKGPLVFSVHLEPPWPRPAAAWCRELPKLADLLHTLPDTGGPESGVLVGGDFNATFDHGQFRRLLRHGFRDAWLDTARTPLFSWSPNRRVPPLLGLDHVLLRHARARVIRTLPVPGTDHHAVFAEIVLAAGSE
jgi:endonuclease/exonuclease/phosphatase (EEP) superfamily protein YafD